MGANYQVRAHLFLLLSEPSNECILMHSFEASAGRKPGFEGLLPSLFLYVQKLHFKDEV